MDTVSPKTEIHLHPQPSEPSVGVYESYFKPGTLGLEELHTVLFNHQQLVSVTKCSGARMARKKRPCHQSQIYAESRLPHSKERLNYWCRVYRWLLRTSVCGSEAKTDAGPLARALQNTPSQLECNTIFAHQMPTLILAVIHGLRIKTSS